MQTFNNVKNERLLKINKIKKNIITFDLSKNIKIISEKLSD